MAGVRPATTVVVSCRLHNGQAVFLFEGVTSIDDAEKLRGLEVQVPLSERASLPSGRYYISDLIGCTIWEEGAASPLGVVREVQPLAETGATYRNRGCWRLKRRRPANC